MVSDLNNFLGNTLSKGFDQRDGFDKQETDDDDGDFNCVQDPRLDKNGGSDNMDKSRVINTINVLKNTFDLDDIWRIRNPDKRQFT